MSRAEFDWRAVLAAWSGADLSRQVIAGRVVCEVPPLWPSARYRDAFYLVRRRLIAPPRGKPTTTAQVGEAADALFTELALALRERAVNPTTQQRWEEAAKALVEAKRLAEATRQPPPLVES